jgi:DNA-binding transcriptional ArsR family regulator
MLTCVDTQVNRHKQVNRHNEVNPHPQVGLNAQADLDPQVDLSEEQVLGAVMSFKMLADPTRLRIVWTLLHGEHSVNELAEHLGVQPSAVSQHLAKLRLAGLVSARRAGHHIYYLAVNEHVRCLAKEALRHAGHAASGDPRTLALGAPRQRGASRGAS